MSRGVRQGDPLSPLLFNLVMDEIIENIKDTGLGVLVGGQRISTIAYADDVVLLAETPMAMQRMVIVAKKSMLRRGMGLNSTKCCNFTTKVAPHSKRLYPSESTTIIAAGAPILRVGSTHGFKYLGQPVGPLIGRLADHDGAHPSRPHSPGTKIPSH